MAQKTFTKEQIARTLGIQPYMVAAWQKKFDVKPTVLNGKESYTHKDLATLKTVKELLYEKGFSLDAAKKYLHEKPPRGNTTLRAASPLLFGDTSQPSSAQVFFSSGQVHQARDKQLTHKLLTIKKQLEKLRDTLS